MVTGNTSSFLPLYSHSTADDYSPPIDFMMSWKSVVSSKMF